MSAPLAVDQTVTTPSDQSETRPNRAQVRLEELRRALQRQARRKLNVVEQAALDNAALLQLRSEMALRDPAADSNSIVRLSNAARRAMTDFQALVAPRKREPSYEALGL
jgi:hypothetical protein